MPWTVDRMSNNVLLDIVYKLQCLFLPLTKFQFHYSSYGFTQAVRYTKRVTCLTLNLVWLLTFTADESVTDYVLIGSTSSWASWKTVPTTYTRLLMQRMRLGGFEQRLAALEASTLTTTQTRLLIFYAYLCMHFLLMTFLLLSLSRTKPSHKIHLLKLFRTSSTT